jgi:hypothetical protein
MDISRVFLLCNPFLEKREQKSQLFLEFERIKVIELWIIIKK